jgi:hypothetical protein
MSKCAFDLDKKCAALDKKECKGCGFFKTKEELDEGRKKADARIISLETPLREYIMGKYYGGRRIYKG